MARILRKMVTVLVCAVLIFQLAACGYFMYPERRGQTGGRIDPGVAILDAIGLLFFIIPGVIAFAVDFTNGTIYLPGTATSSLDIDDIREVRFDPKDCDMATIERIIKEETGHHIRLDQENMEVSKLESIDDMMLHFAEALPGINGARTALSMK